MTDFDNWLKAQQEKGAYLDEWECENCGAVYEKEAEYDTHIETHAEEV